MFKVNFVIKLVVFFKRLILRLIRYENPTDKEYYVYILLYQVIIRRSEFTKWNKNTVYVFSLIVLLKHRWDIMAVRLTLEDVLIAACSPFLRPEIRKDVRSRFFSFLASKLLLVESRHIRVRTRTILLVSRFVQQNSRRVTSGFYKIYLLYF